ncbi:hypothetical protein Peur_016964 [Populus x canadensis]
MNTTINVHDESILTFEFCNVPSLSHLKRPGKPTPTWQRNLETLHSNQDGVTEPNGGHCLKPTMTRVENEKANLSKISMDLRQKRRSVACLLAWT